MTVASFAICKNQRTKISAPRVPEKIESGRGESEYFETLSVRSSGMKLAGLCSLRREDCRFGLRDVGIKVDVVDCARRKHQNAVGWAGLEMGRKVGEVHMITKAA